MIKRLDKLILRAFIGPFVATFFITLFVLVLQFFWLYIDDIVGKGVDMITIGKLITYVGATVVPLALPLAILLSSIMTFGNLGESFELVAIKSAGIPLLRFMRPLFIVSIFLCGLAFLFNNNVIPVANLKMQTLKFDIIMSKPAFDIKEGVFYDKIEGYVIKIGKKEKDDSTIRKVVIYEKNYGLQDNVLVAESGIMRMSKDNRFLELILKNGWRYQENGDRLTTNTEFIRLGFDEYKKVMDLSSFALLRTPDSVFRQNYQMLSLRQLNKSIDSLEKINQTHKKKTLSDLKAFLQFPRYVDSSWWTKPMTVAAPKNDTANAKNDTLKQVKKSFAAMLPDSARTFVRDRAMATINSVKANLESNASLYETQRRELRFHLIAWHEKFTMAVACMVLFLIGAPLGSIIRKGGIGTPLVFAVIFFVVFFLLNNFGKKFVKEDVMLPLYGMWLATFALLPIGLFLIYKAMHDSQLFNKEYYYRFFRAVRSLVQRLPFMNKAEAVTS
ncbi:MAG TPA: LptF/LptG family permease [Chitinophagaceae bacterium]|nr:LptF/LptG family permease [Chitinophagaceae bacterium]